jgi:glycosyltransferase involved in cell wall biosynthesis
MRTEARRMRRFEASVVAAADVTIALSSSDAARLSALSPSARVLVVPPPAPAFAFAPAASISTFTAAPALASSRSEGAPPPSTHAANAAATANAAAAADVADAARAKHGASVMDAASGKRLEGDPAFVWIGSAGWSPNAEAVRWLLDAIWPAVASRLPRARLHVFGVDGSRPRGDSSGDAAARARDVADSAITWHPAPADSRVAFAPGAILLLPLTIASGVRMRLLEAWASGMPVIASPAAVEGLETADGDDVLIAHGAAAFSEAAVRLASDADLRARLAVGGRATIARRHDPAVIADAVLAAYHEAIALRLARAGAEQPSHGAIRRAQRVAG